MNTEQTSNNIKIYIFTDTSTDVSTIVQVNFFDIFSRISHSLKILKITEVKRLDIFFFIQIFFF